MDLIPVELGLFFVHILIIFFLIGSLLLVAAIDAINLEVIINYDKNYFKKELN